MRLRAVEPEELAAGPDSILRIQPRAKVALGLNQVLLPIGLVSAASTAVLLIGLEAQERWSAAPRPSTATACDVVPDKPWWKWACTTSAAADPTSAIPASLGTPARGPAAPDILARELPRGAVTGWADLQGGAGAPGRSADAVIGNPPPADPSAQVAALNLPEQPDLPAAAETIAGPSRANAATVTVEPLPDTPDATTLFATLAPSGPPAGRAVLGNPNSDLIVTASLPEPETLAILVAAKPTSDLAWADASIDASVDPITAVPPVPLAAQCASAGCDGSDRGSEANADRFLVTVPPIAPLTVLPAAALATSVPVGPPPSKPQEAAAPAQKATASVTGMQTKQTDEKARPSSQPPATNKSSPVQAATAAPERRAQSATMGSHPARGTVSSHGSLSRGVASHGLTGRLTDFGSAHSAKAGRTEAKSESGTRSGSGGNAGRSGAGGNGRGERGDNGRGRGSEASSGSSGGRGPDSSTSGSLGGGGLGGGLAGGLGGLGGSMGGGLRGDGFGGGLGGGGLGGGGLGGGNSRGSDSAGGVGGRGSDSGSGKGGGDNARGSDSGNAGGGARGSDGGPGNGGGGKGGDKGGDGGKGGDKGGGGGGGKGDGGRGGDGGGKGGGDSDKGGR